MTASSPNMALQHTRATKKQPIDIENAVTTSVNSERLRIIRSMRRSEPFASQSFDFQDAYKCLFELRDGNRLETPFYVHLQRFQYQIVT